MDEDGQPAFDSIDLDALEKSLLKGKRNVAAMARLGLMREAAKRSIATLAKNGQLPTRENGDDEYAEWNADKRNIGSVARTGTLSGKRNVGALARDFLLPPNGKRNLPSILRSGGGSSTSSTHGPQHQPKRNVATLARDNVLPYYHQSKNEKRDVSAVNNKRMLPLKTKRRRKIRRRIGREEKKNRKTQIFGSFSFDFFFLLTFHFDKILMLFSCYFHACGIIFFRLSYVGRIFIMVRQTLAKRSVTLAR